ncbi:unnamed protein product [Prorocentrum cordatum]|uniref:Uncharacterized protein n=1 Tax=Prorocentrum cordatum TaxID=2364126 RepID=A0ABN9UBW8_9DINO|nr:unnamed protein product [Polarella glacialis]
MLVSFDAVAVDLPSLPDEASSAASPAWHHMTRDVGMLGYHMEGTDGWKLFGITKYEGLDPGRATIHRPADLLQDLEQDAKREWLHKGDIALQQCIGELKNVMRERKDMLSTKDRLPCWVEADAAVLEHLMKEISRGSSCMLKLSNVLRSVDPVLQGHSLVTMLEAREFVDKLIQGGEHTDDALQRLEGRGVVTWCPTGREDIGRICAGIAKAAMAGRSAQVSLVIPLDPRLGCHSIRQFCDTWSHELLQGKWAPFIRHVQLSHEPMKIVVTGLHAPMHQVKSLCMVTLIAIPGADSNLVIVDVAAEDEVDFLIKTGQVSQYVITSWNGPTKAASSTPDSKRIIYTGRLGVSGNWAPRVPLVALKETFLGIDMVLGLRSTRSNPDTILVDISGLAAAIKVHELIEGAALVPPRLLVARSTASEVQWGPTAYDFYHTDAGAYVEKARFLAEPPVLDEQKDAKRIRARGSDGKELDMIIRVSGEFVGARLLEVPSFVSMTSTATGLPLSPSASETSTVPYQWKPMVDARRGWQGHALLHVRTTEEVLLTFERLEGKTTDLAAGGRMAIEVIPTSRGSRAFERAAGIRRAADMHDRTPGMLN